MGFKELNEVGVADLFYNAAIILKERGHAKGATLDPTTGKVDARGALLLAAGAKPTKIGGQTTTPEEAQLATYWIPKVYVAIEIIEALFEDIDEWNDLSTQQEIIAGFRKIENIIRIAIT